MCVFYFQTMKLPLRENLVCNNFKYSDVFDECCELDVIVNGDRWTYYDLGCMYDLWFEILRDFMDYRDYMGLSSVVWLCKWSLSSLISYNLGGFVTSGLHRDINVCANFLSSRRLQKPWERTGGRAGPRAGCAPSPLRHLPCPGDQSGQVSRIVLHRLWGSRKTVRLRSVWSDGPRSFGRAI